MIKETFIIEGLAGAKTLKGTVNINGAKNAALKAMAAAVLFNGPVTLENIPDTADVETMKDILIKLGVKVSWPDGSDSQKLTIDSSSMNSTSIDEDLAKGMRASVVLTGPILARFNKVTFPAPGGCVIGARPIDRFIDGYNKMGATVVEKDCLYHIEAPGSFKSAEIKFAKITVGGTETLMMAAVLGKGTTILKNCAMEPEIVNVAEWLNACGANIKGVGTPAITIVGTNGKLLTPKESFVTIPDRIEAGSFLILGALCAEELVIRNCRPDHLESAISLLKESGANITVKEADSNSAGSIKVTNKKGTKPFKFVNVITHEYPGFATDLQAPMVVYLTQATGESTILETIFEGRFKYTEDLVKMGANIKVINPHEIVVKGPTPLSQLPHAEKISAHDIRAGFAVVLAALVGKGKFVVNNVHLIDRGYEKLEDRLASLGANIQRFAK